MDNNDLTQAYQTVFDGEKLMLAAVRDLISKFQSDVQAAKGDQSSNVVQTPAWSFIGRVEAAISNLSSYDLPNVLSQYGLTMDGGAGSTPSA